MEVAILDTAIQLARTNPIKGLPQMAAVLVVNGKAFYGFNSRKTHPLAKKFGKNKNCICLHAEIDALRRCISAGVNPKGGSMYVARVFRNGEPALAKPCSGCESAIVGFDLKNVEWTENSS